MKTEYDITTKDKEMSYTAFILASLIKLGLSPSNKGTYYLRDLILLALQNNVSDDIHLKELREKLAKLKGISAKTIKSNIDYAFQYKNTEKAEKNFETLLGIEYDSYFITVKTVMALILNAITMTQK